MSMDSKEKKFFAAALSGIIVILTSMVVFLNQPDTPPPSCGADTTAAGICVPPDTLHPPVDTTHPPDTVPTPPAYNIGEGVATVAKMPTITVDTTYPVTSRKIRVAAGSNFQAVLDSAKGGDEILTPVGATFTGNFIIRNKTTGSGWIVIRTDLPDSILGRAGTQMTPSRAAALRLTKFISPNYSPVFGTENSSHHYRFVGIEAAPAAAVTQMNMLIRFGESGGNGQKTKAQTPHDLAIDRSYVHGTTTGAIRRCALLNSMKTLVIDSWFDECHDPGGDSQATLGYNGSDDIWILRNTLIAGHEIVMWGGSDPADSTMSPRRIRLWFNHIYRPASWIGKWQMKTLLETKNVKEYDIFGNVIENVKADAQAGFAILFKSENQDCTATYSQSADITIRYNVIRNTGNGFNFSGLGSNSGQCKNTPATRFTVQHNWLYNMNLSPWVSQGITTQLLSSMSHVIFSHNTLDNCRAGSSLNLASLDGAPAATQYVFTNNIACNGEYGFKGGNCASATPCLNMYTVPWVMKGNAFVGGSNFPPNNTVVASLAAAVGTGTDGLPVGADTTAIKRLTQGVIVAP